jgi:hypothetical protein
VYHHPNGFLTHDALMRLSDTIEGAGTMAYIPMATQPPTSDIVERPAFVCAMQLRASQQSTTTEAERTREKDDAHRTAADVDAQYMQQVLAMQDNTNNGSISHTKR